MQVQNKLEIRHSIFNLNRILFSKKSKQLARIFEFLVDLRAFLNSSWIKSVKHQRIVFTYAKWYIPFYVLPEAILQQMYIVSLIKHVEALELAPHYRKSAMTPKLGCHTIVEAEMDAQESVQRCAMGYETY